MSAIGLKEEKLILSMLEDTRIKALITLALSIDENVEIGGIIFKTKNLDNLDYVEGNRDVNSHHAKMLKESIKEGFNVGQPIVLDEKLKILDGQHRTAACKALMDEGEDIDLYFTFQDTANSLKTVQEMQTKRKNWNVVDYINSYAVQGNEHYINLKRYLDAHEDILSNTCLLRLINFSRSDYTTNTIKTGAYEFDQEKYLETVKTINYLRDYIEAVTIAKEKFPHLKEEANRAMSALRGEYFASALRVICKREEYDHKFIIARIQNGEYIVKSKNATPILKQISICKSIHDAGEVIIGLNNTNRVFTTPKLPSYCVLISK